MCDALLAALPNWPRFDDQTALRHRRIHRFLDAVRVAVNRVYGDLTTPITNNDEVAFFPPVTGGD